MAMEESNVIEKRKVEALEDMTIMKLMGEPHNEHDPDYQEMKKLCVQRILGRLRKQASHENDSVSEPEVSPDIDSEEES